ncbi:HisA/HisF-related TIM barrel protein, partial [Acinetobacter baumannii]
TGYDLALTRAVSEAVEVPVIASGGAGKPEHLVDAVIEGKADAVLLAGIIHDGVYRIDELKQYMRNAGLDIRLANHSSSSARS